MRWLYFDATNPDETTAHATVMRKIDDWWRRFAAKTDDLNSLFAQRSEWDLPAWMECHLQAIDENLMWEFGPALRGDGHRLVITPEAETHLRPMVQTILERSPNLPGWEFYPYRVPEDLTMAEHTVAGRTGGDLKDTFASLMVGQHNRINVCYYADSTLGSDDAQALSNAFVATETLLGEELLDRWVGVISVDRLPKPPGKLGRLMGGRQSVRGLIPLDRLQPTVVALVSSIQDQLPNKPLYVLQPANDSEDSQTPHSVLQITPTPADDYPRYLDKYVAVTANVDFWRAAHEDGAFYSERYSRYSETFCYLKLDGSAGLDEEKFPDRASIEDALNEVLVPARAGCAIGGGTGLRYSYIDLALTDVNMAIPLIQSRLRAGNINRRTWLLFFDAPFAHEWVGMYNDTPAPPSAEP
jgi:hypothetical protein